MTKIIDFKTKKVIKTVSAVDQISLKNTAKEHAVEGKTKLHNTHIQMLNNLIYEINKVLTVTAVQEPYVKTLSLKVASPSALALRNGLFKDIYLAYKDQGILLDYQFIPQDGINYYGIMRIYWDLNYKRWYNRLYRKMALYPFTTILIITLSFIIWYFLLR